MTTLGCTLYLDGGAYAVVDIIPSPILRVGFIAVWLKTMIAFMGGRPLYESR